MKKTIESSPFFVAAAETWLDGQPSEFFLSGLQKLEQRAKKCIELRGGYGIPSLVAVACFLPGRAKDLSAIPRNSMSAMKHRKTSTHCCR